MSSRENELVEVESGTKRDSEQLGTLIRVLHGNDKRAAFNDAVDASFKAVRDANKVSR